MDTIMLIVIAILLAMILIAQLAPDLARHIIVYSFMALVALAIIGIFAGIGVYAYTYHLETIKKISQVLVWVGVFAIGARMVFVIFETNWIEKLETHGRATDPKNKA
jgi:drug/metabolite transporter (DMT)-like permease